VFSLELSSSAIPSPIPSAGGGSNAVMGREEVRMEDLLQAQFENEQNLLAFEGMATFSINMLIHQINKSESERDRRRYMSWN
jgi:Ras GTPase-activating-like protein IQGAP2/3